MNEEKFNLEKEQKTDFDTGPTSLGLSPFLLIMICYVFGWVSGLIVSLLENTNMTVKRCAARAFVINLSLFIISTTMNVLPYIRRMSDIPNILYFIFAIIAIIDAKKFKEFTIPVAEPYVEKFFNFVSKR